jgi:hypothetical protein
MVSLIIQLLKIIRNSVVRLGVILSNDSRHKPLLAVLTTAAPTPPDPICPSRPDSTAGELKIMALLAVSVLKYIWPQIAWAWNVMISFSVNRELSRHRLANREEQRANHEEQMGEMAELRRIYNFFLKLQMNSSDFFYAVSSTTASPPVVPGCDCSGRPELTAGELTIMVLSAVSVLKYI